MLMYLDHLQNWLVYGHGLLIFLILALLWLTLVSQIVEHTEIDEHLEQIAENLIVEHLIYTIFIATNNRTSGIFFHCVNSQTRLTIRDTRVVKRVKFGVSGHFPENA